MWYGRIHYIVEAIIWVSIWKLRMLENYEENPGTGKQPYPLYQLTGKIKNIRLK